MDPDGNPRGGPVSPSDSVESCAPRRRIGSSP
jgi:hypothetical protein